MSLRDHKIKSEYRSKIDKVIQNFYIPLLKEAAIYKRAVGFFSSSSLVEISKGISALAKNGGKIHIVASPYLQDDDIEAIKKGYESRQNIIEGALLRQLTDEKLDYYSMERLNLLANLIADGVLDIRIAYTEDYNGLGMYHEKMGIIEDADGNKVAFSGSMNESATAMLINYETVDVFCAWKSDYEAHQVALKENAFFSIWNDTEPDIKVMEFPKITQTLIDKYKKKAPNFAIDEQQFIEHCSSKGKVSESLEYGKPLGARMPNNVQLYDYQEEAIAVWVGENYRGIFDMATGTGKTYTGLSAIARLSEDLNDRLAVVIVCPYQHLVDQWVEDIVKFKISPVIGYSSSPQKDWKKRFSKAVRDQKLRDEKRFLCFVCTNATFTNTFVQEEISKIRCPILIVVDEAHNFGARSLSSLLDDRFTYRLALSATLERFRDEEGTQALYNFFGKKCIEYPLERAIRENKLTPYKYHPVVVNLTEEELQAYEKLSFEMSKCLMKDKSGKIRLSKRGEILALQRARIVSGAVEKLDALRREIQPYAHEKNILVYCGATNVLYENADSTSEDDNDMRQIEAVTKILGNELGMNVSRFTSDEKMDERNAIKTHFMEGSLQVIVAIKCLDEGVNIPGIRTAFILASTTNPKEYIQRRGRVLRKAPNKDFAEIYDFVTLPRSLDSVSGLTKEQVSRDVGLVKNELRRIIEFGRLSMNAMDSNALIWNIEETYHITEESLSGEGEW